MIPRLENSLLFVIKLTIKDYSKKWLCWITRELSREEWFDYDIMIHDAQLIITHLLVTRNTTHAHAQRFDFGRAAILFLGNLGSTFPLPLWNEVTNEGNVFTRGKTKGRRGQMECDFCTALYFTRSISPRCGMLLISPNQRRAFFRPWRCRLAPSTRSTRSISPRGDMLLISPNQRRAFFGPWRCRLTPSRPHEFRGEITKRAKGATRF